MTKLLPIFLLILFSNCSIAQNNFEKYSIEQGTLKTLFIPFSNEYGETFKVDITFKNFGRIENYEFKNSKNNFDRILKLDSIEYHIFSEDSIGIETIRSPIFVYDLIVLNEKSKFKNIDFTFQFIADTTYLNKKCEFYTFQNVKSDLSGIAIFWKGIPFYIDCQYGKMITQLFKTEIEDNLLKLDENIDVGQK